MYTTYIHIYILILLEESSIEEISIHREDGYISPYYSSEEDPIDNKDNNINPMINNESKIINDTINNTDALTVQAGTLSKKKKKQTPSDRGWRSESLRRRP